MNMRGKRRLAMKQDTTNHEIRAMHSASELECEKHHLLYDYWLIKKGANAFPAFSDIDLLDFPDDANLWAIVRVVPNGKGDVEFSFHFVGPGIVSLVELEPTGTDVSNLERDYSKVDFGSDSDKVFRKVLEVGGPVLNGPTDMPLPNEEVLRFLSFSLPLAANGSEISHILTAISVISKS